MEHSTIELIKVAATVAGATATVIGLISKPLWKKLTSLAESLDQKICQTAESMDGKLNHIGSTMDSVKARVGEQNGRIGKIETWTDMHEDHDDERHEETMARRKELYDSLHTLRTEVQAAIRRPHP